MNKLEPTKIKANQKLSKPNAKGMKAGDNATDPFVAFTEWLGKNDEKANEKL